MNDRDAEDWEQLAQREPYFPVRAGDGRNAVSSSPVATAVFFETGEEDLATLLAATAVALQRDVPLSHTLDFGCGAGRVTLPLARRARSVVACDIAPTMLTHVRENAQAAGLRNVTCIDAAALKTLPRASFDFVVSLLVLQYISPAEGYGVVRTIVELLASGGVAALHMPMRSNAGALRRMARWSRRGRDASPSSRSHFYVERVLQREVAAAGGQIVARLPMGTDGAVVVMEKR